MDRGDVVVVVPVYGARELFEDCLRSVVANTTPGTRIVVADDASPDREIEAFARGFEEVEYVRREQNLGFVRNMNAAFRDTAPADVVIVNSDTVVPPAWLERLRAAALSEAGWHARPRPVASRGARCPISPAWVSFRRCGTRRSSVSSEYPALCLFC